MRTGLILAGMMVIALSLTGCERLQRPGQDDPNGLEFQGLGCNEDWPMETPIEPIIERISTDRPSFLVRAPDECGLVIEDPAYSLSGTTLTLSYVARAPAADEVAACSPCEYRSRFSFRRLPGSIETVRFKSR